jgi:predicted regulator of Ras-like GTPase activity (Roadblock/LC7/MglB family)
MLVAGSETKGMHAFQVLREDPNALERLARSGVRNFLLASGDGLVIDAVIASKTLDVDEIAASAASALNTARTRAAPLRKGDVQGIVVEFLSGEIVVLDPVADDAMAVYLADSPAGAQQLGKEVPHLRSILTGIEPAPAPPQSSRAAADKTTVPPAQAPETPDPRPAPRSPAARVALKKAEIETAGFTATAIVELALGDRRAVGKAVGRNIPDQYLALAAEATIRAVTEFLPTGYGIVLENIQPVSSATEVAVWANVLFITPTDEQLLPGIARLENHPPLTAAKTILNAVNRRLELVLAEAAR